MLHKWSEFSSVKTVNLVSKSATFKNFSKGVVFVLAHHVDSTVQRQFDETLPRHVSPVKVGGLAVEPAGASASLI